MAHRKSVLALIIALAASGALAPQSADARSPELAIGGYDPVAYFTKSAPQKGLARWQTEWNGALWHFASEENKKAFLNDPQAFAPKYNGFCAYAAAQGYVAEVDPINGWSIRNDKLYLNWSTWVKRRWQLRAAKYIRDADKNWPNLKAAIEEGNVDISRK